MLKKAVEKAAKKTPPAPAAEETAQPGRICFERIIPDDLDPERAVRRTLRETMAAHEGRTLNADEIGHIARMAVAISKRWPAAATVRCRFLDGSPRMKRKVQEIAHEWEKHAKIRLKFVTSGEAEIRISFFADSGSWSAVGRDALNRAYFPLHQPTMNYGWLRDSTDDEEYSRVVLHEFGHALGSIHEHQSPKFTRKWNTKAVMKYFQGPPNFWSADEVTSNVLAKYSPKGISATEFDPKSIMLYFFDAKLFADGLGPTNSNTKLSQRDMEKIKEMYS
jgi:serralysin